MRPIQERLEASWELVGLGVLSALSIFFLATSWMKWPDPLIDFGRELYLPWQLAQGALLYRDAEDFYGPLSQYVNAGFFLLFGPGLKVLVMANLAIWTAIVVLIYRLFREAWGSGSAFVSTALFISVFSFSQFTGFGNYNFATPYSHEATHGLLACLALVPILAGLVSKLTAGRSFLAGLLLGLTLVLKPEIALAAAVISVAAVFLRSRIQPDPGLPLYSAVGLWLFGVTLPTAVFVGFFLTEVPLVSALEFSSRAWLSVIGTSRFINDPSQLTFLGLDRPVENLLHHAFAAAVAIVLVAGICVGAQRSDGGKGQLWLRPAAVLLVVGVAAISVLLLRWEYVGRSLLGLMLAYLVMNAAQILRRRDLLTRKEVVRVLLAVLAAALMARMLLNGRIYQFGFYQAALAALIVPAVIIGELPGRLGLGDSGRRVMAWACLALCAPGALTLVAWSRHMLQMKTYPVGEGRDRFYAYDPRIERTGEFVRTTAETLRKAAGGTSQTLVVLPDGEMLNYLARMRSPVAPAFFFSAATAHGREALIVRELEANRPDWVVIISRDLREFGIARYGERTGQGRMILDWVEANYETAARMGGDPLVPKESGVVLMADRK